MTIIERHLKYCSPVSGCCGKTDIERLQKLQNRAARIASNSSYDALPVSLVPGADVENFITVAHRAWLVTERGKTKEFCDCLLWGC